MFSIKEIVQPNSVDEAYKILVSKTNNSVLGGCAYLRLGSKQISTAIDLSNLDLDYVLEHETEIEIGASTTLRELEVNPILIENFNGLLTKAVANIIGVQLRNVATVGASVYSKYGFSDLITALLVLQADVELYTAGRMSLENFLNRPYEKDILIKIFMKKNQRHVSYQHLRNSVSDYPIINVAVSKNDDQWVIAVGARPQRAAIAKKASQELSNMSGNENSEYLLDLVTEELAFGSNARGTATYREAMCKVLVKRAIAEVQACK